MQPRTRRLTLVLLGAAALAAGEIRTRPARAESSKIGVNIVLNDDATDAVLADLALHGTVLEELPEIRAVTMCADADELPLIQSLSYVMAAEVDEECTPAVTSFVGGASDWNLDALNVTDFGAGRTVAYTGAGVYVAVIDSGLCQEWREYFPEERIDAVHGISFGGGLGEKGTVSTQRDKWEHDTWGHGTWVTSTILGFSYQGPDALPATFNGVAPCATVIPVKVFNNNRSGGEGHDHNITAANSTITRAILYVAGLKASGELGSAPVVINMSLGGFRTDPAQRAAIDYAIAQGVVVVAVAHNLGDRGMTFPGRYAPVISVANAGWARQFPVDDPTEIVWCVRDVPEGDANEFFISPDSSRELAGQDLDVAGPGFAIPVPFGREGSVDYTFAAGTSLASPQIAGVAALMLEKNPTLTAAQIESILESTTLALPPGSRATRFPSIAPGNAPTFSDHANVSLFDITISWGANATGSGLVRADAALAATPNP